LCHHKLTGGVGVNSVSSTAVTGCRLASLATVFEVSAAVGSWLGTSVGVSVVGDSSEEVGSIIDALVETTSVVVFTSVGLVVVVMKSTSLVVTLAQIALLKMTHDISLNV
jgi:hypothetical protein